MKSEDSLYQKALDLLTSQGKFHINLGLERVQKTLDLMDNPQKRLKFIHVAGTNGKGSVCAMLSSILSCCPFARLSGTLSPQGRGEKEVDNLCPSPNWGEGGRSSDEGVFRFKTMYSEEALKNAKRLRKKTTDTEKILWFYLRNRRLNGLKFRRQVPVGNYIADFVCKENKLIIEIDGSGHLMPEQIKHDEKRQKDFEVEGYKILRFYSTDIFNNIECVLEQIYNLISSFPPVCLSGAFSPVGSGGKKLKVGLFTSPHVFEYTERIKINDIEIEKEVFAQKLFEIVELAEKNEIHLTEFEILTVLAFDYFAEKKVDIVILETGLGGRLDATNVIDENLCSVITHIDLDHTERLGETIAQIAYEKAGIIKNNCPVVIGKNNAGFEVIKKVAKEQQADDFSVSLAPWGRGQGEGYLSLKGVYQKENLALVIGALEVLKEKGFEIPDEAIEQGLKNVKHPCRFEYIEEKNLLIDGAHNPDGARVLRESLEESFPDQTYRFIFGCLRNKNYSQMMQNLFRQGDEVYFYEFNNENSASYSELSAACEVESAVFRKYEQSDKLTVICGSFYMIKELLTKIAIK